MVDELLALFPLHTVLFPGMPLPLHIFEERYKLMIGRCLEEERPFGVVLIQSGPEVGGPAVPHMVGTTAHIASAKRADDGRMNLIAIGQARFRIIEIVRHEPYLIARVAPHGDVKPAAAAPALAAEVHAILATYLRDLFALLEQPEEELQIPIEPARLSMVAAAVMQIPMSERQALLELTDVGARLQQEKEWLGRENEKQRALLRARKHLGAVMPLDSSQVIERISLN